MKPVSLRMVNVGPFKDELIDFTKLADMFLITGNTGSGKTSILDSITFALYGSFAGNRSEKSYAKLFRSNFAKADEKSFVVFVFSVDTKVYRVTRFLPHKSKGSEATLEVLVDDEWKLFVDGRTVTEVNNKIQNDILHLSLDEFCRIILLPQGAFSEFLKQNTNEKRETLAKLFPVDIYIKVAAVADEKRKELEREISFLEERLRSLYGNSSIEDDVAEKERCDIRIKEIETKIADIEKNYKSVIELIKEKESILDSQIFADKLKEEIEQLEGERESIDVLQEKIRLSKEASSLLMGIHDYEEAENHLSLSLKNVENYEKELKQATNERDELLEKKGEIDSLKELQFSYPKEIEKLSKQISDTKSYNKALRDVERLLSETEKLKDLLKKNGDELSAKLDFIKSVSEKYEIVFNDENSVYNAVCELKSSLDISIAELKSKIFAADSIKNNISLKEKQNDMLKSLSEKLCAQRKLRDDTKSLLDSLEDEKENAIQNNHASVLSRLLKADCPCPVCGSTVHPSPAVAIDISELEKNIATAQQNLENVDSIIENLDDEHKTLAAENKSCLDTIKNYTESVGLSCIDEFESFYGELKSVYDEKSHRISVLESDIEKLSISLNDIKSIRKLIDSDTKSLSDFDKELASASATCDTLSSGVDVNADADELCKKLDELKSKQESESLIINDFDEKYDATSSKCSLFSGMLLTANQSVDSDKLHLESCKKIMEDCICKSSFENAQDVKACVLVESELQNAESNISQWADSLKEKKTLFSEKDKGVSVSDLRIFIAELKNRESAFSNDKSLLENEKINLSSKSRQIVDKVSEVKMQEVNLEKKKKSAEAYIQLAKDLNGVNAKNVPLDAWILALYFSHIIEVANKRLFDLSNGHYEFRLDDKSTAGNKKNGLELVIYDYYAQVERPTSTLSGGETFEASICLALALTDVVQSRNGGIKLDSLFIDEGFGSLDEESLGKAINILHKIQEHKTVAVISHVSEMKEAISSHIEVHKNRSSSHITII